MLIGGLATALLPVAACGRPDDTSGNASRPVPDIAAALTALEAEAGVRRLGFAILDGRDGTLVGHRLDERFTMCSTFKLSLAAAVLSRIDAGDIAAEATLSVSDADLVTHSPAVREALATGQSHMSVLALAEAAQTLSDNAASNILLRHIGGPEALTAMWRSLGDQVTRLDRYEPDLNTSHGEDARDTTTPAAMARSMSAITSGPLLKPASRERLIGWMVDTQTGLKRLRAGIPDGWRAGDKTGTNAGDGSYDSKANDIAILWHPERAEPFFLTGFLEVPVREKPELRPEDDAVLASAARIAAQWIQTRI